MADYTNLWERANKAIAMLYEEGFNAYPLERAAFDADAQGVLEALDEHFVFVDHDIGEYLDEIRFCCNKLVTMC